MSVKLRPYLQSEFERACEIREISSPESNERFKLRFEKAGDWFDHYSHLAIEKDGVLVGDFQLRKYEKTMPDGCWEMGLELLQDDRGKGFGTEALFLEKDVPVDYYSYAATKFD